MCMNKKIEDLIKNGNQEELIEAIREYEKKNSDDFDTLSYYVQYYFMLGDYGKAIDFARTAASRNPFSIEASYNCAVCADAIGLVPEAYEYYNRTLILQSKSEMCLVEEDELRRCIDTQNGKASELEKEAIVEINTRLNYVISDPYKRYDYSLIGEGIVDPRGQIYYVGRAEGWFEAYFDNERNEDAFHTKCEMFPVDKIGTTYSVDCPGEKWMVPVVLNLKGGKEGNCIKDTMESNEIYYEMAHCKYSYIPVSNQAKFITEQPALFGTPIPIIQKKQKSMKRLVLNLFLDSLNYSVIKKYGLKNIAPNIYRFFSKGLICENFYAGSEFTLPSLATYWTGTHSSKHMSLSEILRWGFIGQDKVFPEYFKEAGYVTAKIGGNDSITPAQGYIAGFDRTVYQKAAEGHLVHSVISDTIEHLKTFRDTNQFVFVDIPDLHGVASGFMRPISVQSQTPLMYRVNDNGGGNTVKQKRSVNKEKIYLRELERVDMYLGILFHYIEQNYSEDEILVSLFSDHGTAFMVDNDQPFISEQRVNVPFFVRTNQYSNQICDEVMESSDYAGIMCKLAGIAYDYKNTDANLPVIFGGNTEREYAFSQSLFIGDPYHAGLHGKDFHIYLDTKNPVNSESRIDMSEVEFYALDSQGNDITEKVDRQYYEKIIREDVAHLIIYNN